MAVDLATLALELDTSGMQRGSRQVDSILTSVERRFDQTLRRVQQISKTINATFNFNTGNARNAAALGQSQNQFAQHQARLQQIAAQGAARQQAIQAQNAARLQQIAAQSAAQQLTISARLNAQIQAAQARAAGKTRPPATGINRILNQSSLVRESGESIGNAGIGLTLLTDKFLALGQAAVKSAFDIDRNVNVLRAFLGSTQAAEQRVTDLIKISQKTPGLTSTLATTLDAQLRTTNVSQGTIDKILPAIGRLNAVAPLGDPQKFAQNLQQLITQGFERADLKELVGQSPLAGQVLAQLFNVDSPTNGKAIRAAAQKAGITTTDAFFSAFAEAASKNQALAGVSESLETRFQKIGDRVSVALRPLGLAIVKTLEPLVEKAIPIIEKLSKAFENLPESTRTAIVAFAAVSAAVGPVLIAIGALVQSVGAVGGLLKAAFAIGGIDAAAGLTGIAAAAGSILLPIAAITAALGLGAVAWNRYGASADDSINLASGFNSVLDDISGLTSGLVSDFNTLDAAVSGVFGTGFLIKFDDVLKGTAADVAIIKDTFELLGVSAFAVIKKLTFGLESLLSGALSFLGIKIESLDGSLARLGGEIAQLDNRFNAGFSNLRATENRIARDTPEQRAIDADVANSLAIENDLIRRANLPDAPKPVGSGSISRARSGGGSSRRAESDARQLRAAEEELAKAIAKSRLDIEENTVKKLIDLDKDGFEKRLTSADSYYETLIKRELQLQDIEKQRVQAELTASQTRLAGAKVGSPEALREKAQQIELESRLTILETERAGTVRKLNDELLKLKTTEKERNNELLKAGSSFGFDIIKKQFENFDAQRIAKRDRPETNLRIEEGRIQALGNAGLLREQQVTDALILTRRAYREELIKSAEARRAEIQATAELEGRFADTSRLDEEIASLQTLGSELTRAEQLQKRFAEQGVIDYSRLNEGVEDLLASQKGLTEIFSDFRANLVSDQFDLIDSGIDKLTKNLGVLGSAFGTLLKDLAKLAASAILRKLLGIDSGQSSSLGFGGGSARSSSPVASLGNFITGGGNASGGGGLGSFLTGGFAGGNPAQAAIGGGSGGGGGVLGSIFSSGQGSGGGSPLSGLLQKIPGIGKLFGGGSAPSLVGGVGPNIGSLPGAIQGVGSLPLTGPTSAASSAGALGSFGGLAAGGLIAGGGLLGSLAGGKSQIGRLLGGAGGSLLGGFAAASFLNPALLPVLFSNPITAIIGGALIGGALLFNFLGGREQRKFRKTVESEYALKVDGKQQGTELYKSIKALGEEKFGKGKFGKNIQPTIRLEKAQEQLAAYGEATGQENNPLVRKFRDRKELVDPSDPRNQFIKRAYGGDVRANQPYIVGDAGRPEVFVPTTAGQIYPSVSDFMRELKPQAAPPVQSGGGWTRKAQETLQMMLSVNVRLTEALERFESMPPEQVVTTGARLAPNAIASAVHTSIQRSSPEGVAIKNEVYKGR